MINTATRQACEHVPASVSSPVKCYLERLLQLADIRSNGNRSLFFRVAVNPVLLYLTDH